MKLTRLLSLLIPAAIALAATGCIDDGFSGSAADQPTFSTDTLDMGVIFTDAPSTTHRFTVYNRADKAISIGSIALRGEHAGLFRLNVDGMSGRDFAGVEIRAKDSIYVFVAATLPPNGLTAPVEVAAALDFTTMGETRTVTLAARGRDVERLRAVTLTADTRLTADRPYQVFDSLVVAPGATLTIDPGAELLFHDGAYMAVRGTLKAVGTPEAEITMAGDRTGNVVSDISFDLMSRQWTGLFFTSTSTDNELSHTCVRNTWQGVTVDRAPLLMVNTRLRNSGGTVLDATHAAISAYGCELAEAAAGVVRLHGGSHTFNHCTLANYYLFSAIGGPLVAFGHYKDGDDSTDDSGLPLLRADFSNCILYGLGTDLGDGKLDGTGITLRRCLLRSDGSDDDNFIACLWDTDPMYRTVREDYLFDYRLQPESPAIGAADPALTAPQAAADRYGMSRGASPDLGAYVYTPDNEQDHHDD